MINIDELVKIIITETIEKDESKKDDPAYYIKVPPIKYELELIQREDGSLYWIE